MNAFVAGLSDELQKLAGYPISRALTEKAPVLPAIRNAALGMILGGSLKGPAGAAAAGLGGAVKGLMSGAKGGRRSFANEALAHLRRGGSAGLMQHERSRIAEGLGMNEERLEKILDRMRTGSSSEMHGEIAEKTLAPFTDPGNVVSRVLHSRALAERMNRGEKLLHDENDLLSAIKGRNRLERAKEIGLPIAGLASAGGLVYGGAKAHEYVSKRRNQARQSSPEATPSSETD